MRRHIKVPIGLTLICALLLSQAACSKSKLVKNADRIATALIEAKPLFQSLIDGGAIPRERGLQIIARLDQGAADARLLADAFRNNDNSGAINLTATLINALETVIAQDVLLIPNAATRTTVLAILAAADIALHVIADNLVKTAQLHQRKVGMVTAWMPQTSAAIETIKRFKKKPNLRCRSSVTGRFVKMQQCKDNPKETEVVRIK